ncbi:MAG TPA: hypothetical protein VFE27_24350 [Acidobacteriaceae bacterium]|nr:hypothetical protein [Acidobacteriaceae bacterium]
MAPSKKMTVELSELEAVELEYKRMQIEHMREEMAVRKDKRDRLEHDRARQVQDFEKSEGERLRRQSVCKHRKGGRDNKFAKGTDANYSININTYPNGDMCISCTRCGKEVWKPKAALRKTDRALYSAMWAEWQKWLDYPTDNSPSGSKIFEVTQDAA